MEKIIFRLAWEKVSSIKGIIMEKEISEAEKEHGKHLRNYLL